MMIRKLLTILLAGGFYLHFGMSSAAAMNEDDLEYQKALQVAETLNEMVRSTRAYYTKLVVQKLKKDGTGATGDSSAQSGYVPLPAQFIRKVTYQIVMDKRAEGDNHTKIALRSLWNLNENQGLSTEFEKEGWKYLVKQQQDQLASKKPLKKIKWKPYTKTDMVGNTPVLRYLSADTAAGKACVSCHNSWEQKADVQQYRSKHGTEVGKTFKKHELLGALSITVPITE